MVLVLEITVIPLKFATVAAVVVAIEQVVQLVASTTISNNGMAPMAVICGVQTIKVAVVAAAAVVATNVSHNNSLLVAVMAAVNRIQVGGTTRHKWTRLLNNIPPYDAQSHSSHRT